MTAPNQKTGPVEAIDSLIYFVRGQKVMLDADLADVYGVTTARLNEQLKRNRDRFPCDFAFRLTAEELALLMSQIATSKKGRGGIGFREIAPPYRVRPRKFKQNLN